MKTIEERFWPKVDFSGAAAGSACWEWTGHRLPKGYGLLGRGGRRGGMIYAHRLSWELHFGPIPGGLFVLHKCDNPPCVRPEHLFLGDVVDNGQDMSRKGRWKNQDPKGERNGMAKLTAAQVAEIRALVRPNRPHWGREALARKYGVSGQMIYFILNGTNWK